MVLAIAMTLAAIALPMFADAQARSRRTEIALIVPALLDAELGYHATYDAWVQVKTLPRTGMRENSSAAAM